MSAFRRCRQHRHQVHAQYGSGLVETLDRLHDKLKASVAERVARRGFYPYETLARERLERFFSSVMVLCSIGRDGACIVADGRLGVNPPWSPLHQRSPSQTELAARRQTRAERHSWPSGASEERSLATSGVVSAPASSIVSGSRSVHASIKANDPAAASTRTSPRGASGLGVGPSHGVVQSLRSSMGARGSQEAGSVSRRASLYTRRRTPVFEFKAAKYDADMAEHEEEDD